MQSTKIKISGLETENNVFLAPLAGYTNAVFRKMCFDLGAGLTFTEMVSAKGLVYGSEKTKELLQIPEGYGGIKACQIFGCDPDIMEAAAKGEDLAPFDLIDINMGCPMPKIYNNGEGSALLNDLPLASKIISAVKRSGKAVSVKFRIGLTDDKIISAEFAKMCEDAGADMITVHGRVRDRIYAGAVNYEAIAQAKKAVKIPVIANGGIFSSSDVAKLIERTGADGAMIARGAMFRPWIFARVTGREYDAKPLVLKQLEDTRDAYGERFACVFMRKMIAFYLKSKPNAASLRVRLMQAPTTEAVKEILNEIDF
ncbi:MAG: tRNA-dihydrouridine synthase [Clostridia bacterium]|nr:tRNA-dihydrouridine synthase [Clostridia bacterium]